MLKLIYNKSIWHMPIKMLLMLMIDIAIIKSYVSSANYYLVWIIYN